MDTVIEQNDFDLKKYNFLKCNKIIIHRLCACQFRKIILSNIFFKKGPKQGSFLK